MDNESVYYKKIKFRPYFFLARTTLWEDEVCLIGQNEHFQLVLLDELECRLNPVKDIYKLSRIATNTYPEREKNGPSVTACRRSR